jgi:branched-chain amino acid transport system permease protein
VPKSVSVGLLTFLGTTVFLMLFGFQGLVSAIIGGLLAGGLGAVLATPMNRTIKAGLLTGLIGVVFVLTYASDRPSIAIIGGMLSGLAAALLASQYQHRDTVRAGVLQGVTAAAIAALFTIGALLLVWKFVSAAAGVSAQSFALILRDTVPGAHALGLGSDVMSILWLSLLTIAIAVLIGGLMGAARSVTGPLSKVWVMAVLGLVVFILPLIDKQANLQLLNSIIPVFVFILLALGLNIVVGYAGLLDLGYAAFFAIGAYTTGILTSPNHQFGIGMNFWLVIWIAAGMAALAGLMLGAPTLPLRGDYLAIVTLGFGEIVPIAFRNLGGGGSAGSLTLNFLIWPVFDHVDLTGGASGISPIPPPVLPVVGAFTPANQIPWFYLIVSIMVLALFFINRLRDSRQGRAWTAMREDELAADAMGINIVRTKLMAFAMGATFSGFAGAFYGAYIGAIFPSSFEFSVSIIILCMVILGGLGNMAGVIVGGLLIMGADRLILPEAANLIRDIAQTKTGSSDIPSFRDLPQFRLMLFGLVLVIMMVVRPEGLLPSARRKAELHPDEDVAKQENADLYDAERDPQLAGR